MAGKLSRMNESVSLRVCWFLLLVLLMASGCQQSPSLEPEGSQSEPPPATNRAGDSDSVDGQAVQAVLDEVDFTGPDLTIDGIYASMKGPSAGELHHACCDSWLGNCKRSS